MTLRELIDKLTELEETCPSNTLVVDEFDASLINVEYNEDNGEAIVLEFDS